MSSRSAAVDSCFNTALGHHRAGRLQQAEDLYRQVLADDKRHCQATHHLGLLVIETGRVKEGLELMKRAAMLSPPPSVFYSDLGEALRRAGELDEALAAARRAIELDPRSAEAHYVLAITLLDAGSD